jgi:hypothetical protein
MDQLSLPIKALKEVRPEGSAHGAAVLPRPAHMLRISVPVPIHGKAAHAFDAADRRGSLNAFVYDRTDNGQQVDLNDDARIQKNYIQAEKRPGSW